MKGSMNKMMATACLLLSMTAHAGFEEGVAAYEKKDFATALKEWEPLASKGHTSAQLNLGTMYIEGQGVPQDYKEAVKWYRLAADQGYANAQNNLGAMCENGLGVHQSRVMAFALYNVSATSDPATDNKAAANREKLASLMTAAEIAAGQSLSREMIKPGMLLKELDKYSKKPAVKEKVNTASSELPANSASSQGPYPARPAKQPGLVSCNTRCNNADCYRTYDDGRRVHFRAKQKFNPLNGQFEWDSGPC